MTGFSTINLHRQVIIIKGINFVIKVINFVSKCHCTCDDDTFPMGNKNLILCNIV